MDATKLLEALSDLRHKRAVIDDAIRALEAALAVIDPAAEPAPPRKTRRRTSMSSLDHAAEILAQSGRMHIEELARRVAKASGRTTTRASLDGGISREIRTNPGISRFERVAPGEYRLRSGVTA